MHSLYEKQNPKRPTAFLPRLPPFGLAGLFEWTIIPTVTCVQTSSHRPERPNYITVYRFGKGGCSQPQKDVVVRINRRRKMLDSTEEESCYTLIPPQDVNFTGLNFLNWIVCCYCWPPEQAKRAECFLFIPAVQLWNIVVAKFATNACGSIWWPNLELMQ